MKSKFPHSIIISALLIVATLAGCKEKKSDVINTPWGSTINKENTADTLFEVSEHATVTTLNDIKANGEMIMLTLSGPQTYYDYHGKGMGVHYLMCEKLAEHLGVTLRIDVCSDTLDMLNRLRLGEGDIIAVPMTKKDKTPTNPKGSNETKDGKGGNDAKSGKGSNEAKGSKATAVDVVGQDFIICAEGWLVNKDNTSLAEAVKAWYKPSMLAETQKQETYLLSSGSVKRHVYPWMLSAEKGQVSSYDNLFKKYAPTASVDWTLLAAQCYQESCFDPKAHSWAGACGLMQIMPSTADHLALPRHRIYEPEANVAAAARYMKELQEEFKDVANPAERLKFALAAYNGGLHHIRDAMALTKKYGGISQRWSDVRHYVLALANAEYYRDPVVKSGYMRGTETANYVDMIVERQRQYRHALRTGTTVISKVNVRHSSSSHNPSGASSLIDAQPHRAAKKNKWR